MLKDPFHQIAAALFFATVLGLALARLRQPLIVAYLILGVLAGPNVLKIIPSDGPIDVMAELGIAILLFLIGLRLDVNILKSIGKPSLASGAGQVLITGTAGTLIALALGLELTPALYVGVALTFSSTIVIVKVLSDKREIDALHGRLSIGYLIVQDIIVVVAMIVINAVASGGGPGRDLLFVLARGAGLILVLGLAMRFVLPRVTEWVTHPPELGILFALGWAAALAALGDALGLGKETGAFLAGVSLASTSYRELMVAKLASVRDFLLLFFFISLGTKLDIGAALSNQVGIAAVLLVYVLVGKPLILMAVLGFMGYRRRTGFLTGVASAQISEFSLILIGLGIAVGHVGEETLSLVIMVAAISIAGSIYLITYSNQIYARIERHLTVFERRKPYRESAEAMTAAEASRTPGDGVILYGLGRLGSAIANRLDANDIDFVGFDFDPSAVDGARSAGHEAYLGDIEDPAFASLLPLERTKLVISSVRLPEANRILSQALDSHGYEGRLIVVAHTEDEAGDLTGIGADDVLLPFDDAADRVTEIAQAELGRAVT